MRPVLLNPLLRDIWRHSFVFWWVLLILDACDQNRKVELKNMYYFCCLGLALHLLNGLLLRSPRISTDDFTITPQKLPLSLNLIYRWYLIDGRLIYLFLYLHCRIYLSFSRFLSATVLARRIAWKSDNWGIQIILTSNWSLLKPCLRAPMYIPWLGELQHQRRQWWCLLLSSSSSSKGKPNDPKNEIANFLQRIIWRV